MSSKTKNILLAIGIGLALILIAGMFWLIERKDARLSELMLAYQANTANQFELLAENTARSDNIYLESRDLLSAQLALISQLPEQILAVLEREEAEPVIITRTTGRVEGETIVVYVDNLDSIPRQFQFLTADGMPVAFYNIVDIEEGGIELETGVYDIYVTTNNIVGIDPQGVPTVITEATIATSAEPNTIHPIDITSSTTWYTEIEGDRFSWWDPHLELGVTAGIDISVLDGVLGGDLAVSFMSYGSSQREILRVLRTGLEADSNGPRISLSPAGYNLGSSIPLIEDTWIYPSFLWAPWKNGYGIGLTISSTL